jgi:hypothetical protein
MESAANPLVFGGQVDISDSAAAGAWPMNALAMLAMRKFTSRQVLLCSSC